MSIAFWSVYVSALHDHNYRLPKLIISSRLMCWRLFVMCAVYFVVLFCFVVKECCGRAHCWSARYDIVSKRSIKKTQSQSNNEKKCAVAKSSMKNEWMLKNRHGKCTLHCTKRLKNASCTRKRSINSWINSCSQRQCMLSNNSRANYDQIPCNKNVSLPLVEWLGQEAWASIRIQQ